MNAILPIMLLSCVGCAPAADDAQLGEWLAQAQAAEAQAAEADAQARHEEVNERASWTLTLTGKVAKPELLPWKMVDGLADSEILARPAHEPIPPRLGGPVVLLVPVDYAVDGASAWARGAT